MNTALLAPLLFASMALAALVGWRLPAGTWRRWAQRLVLGWSLLLGAWWLLPRSPGAAALLLAIGALTLLGCAIRRRWRERPARAVRPGLERAAGPSPWERAVHAGGLALATALAVFLVAWAGSLTSHRPPASEPPDPQRAAATPAAAHHRAFAAWGDGLGELAAFTEREVLRPLPVVGPAAGELMAVRELFATPRSELVHLAERYHLDDLAELPAIRAAFDDDDYRELLRRARSGEATAIPALLAHERTRRLCADEALRTRIGSLTPRHLVATLRELDGDRAARSRATP